MNEDILQLMKDSGILKWKIADKLGYSDAHFSRLIRKPLSTEIKSKILTAMLELSTDSVEKIIEAKEKLKGETS